MKHLMVSIFLGALISLSAQAQSATDSTDKPTDKPTVELRPKSKKSKAGQPSDFFKVETAKFKSAKSKSKPVETATAPDSSENDNSKFPEKTVPKNSDVNSEEKMASEPALPEKSKFQTPKGAVELFKLAELIHQKTGKKLIMSPNVRGSVFLINKQTLSAEEFYRFFLQALALNGYSVLDKDGYTLVDSARNIVSMNNEVVEDPTLVKEEKIITWIYQLKYANASELKNLSSMTSRDGKIERIDATNTFVITDFTTNVQRVQKLLDKLDINSQPPKK